LIISPLQKYRRKEGINFGYIIGASYKREEYQTNTTIYLPDTSVLTNNSIETEYKTYHKFNSERPRTQYLSFHYGFEGKFNFNFNKRNYSRYNSRYFYLGFRLQRDIYLLTSKNKNFYSDLERNNRIIGGAKLNTFEVLMGYALRRSRY
jgi:hypothetical protein